MLEALSSICARSLFPTHRNTQKLQNLDFFVLFWLQSSIFSCGTIELSRALFIPQAPQHQFPPLQFFDRAERRRAVRHGPKPLRIEC